MKRYKYQQCALNGFNIIAKHFYHCNDYDQEPNNRTFTIWLKHLTDAEVTELFGCLYVYLHYLNRYKK